jgi:MFS family permease
VRLKILTLPAYLSPGIKNRKLLKLSLLLISMMTMMAGAVVAPSLPQISNVFADVKYISILSRLVITLPALLIALFSPFFGRLSDRLGRKKLLLFSILLYAIGGTSGYFLNSIYLILAGRIILGIAVAGIMTIATALVGDYFKGPERNGFAGVQGAFMGLGGVFFITIAGWLADIQWQMPFLIYLFAIPAFFLGLIYLYEPSVAKETKEPGTLDVEYNKGMAWLVYALAFIGVVFFYMIPVQIPFLLKKMKGITNSEIGYAISISSFSGAMIALNYKRIKKHLSFKRIFQLAFVFMGSGYLMVYFSENYSTVFISMLIAGVGTGFLMPSGNLWIMEIAPEQIRGRLVGNTSRAIFLGMFFSPILIQPLINLFNVADAFLIASICLGVLVLLLVKK